MNKKEIFSDHLFKGKKIMITGCTSGIGFQSASQLSTLGANLVLCGRSGTKLSETKNKLNNKNKIFTFEQDLSDKNAISNLIVLINM